MDVIFIETSVFALQIHALISDDSYRQLQEVLAYAKTTSADLTPKQIRLLGELVRKEFGSN